MQSEYVGAIARSHRASPAFGGDSDMGEADTACFAPTQYVDTGQ